MLIYQIWDSPIFLSQNLTLKFLFHYEKNHVVPTAWQDEALARDGVSREVSCSALKGETVPDEPLDQRLSAAYLAPV